MGSVWPSVAVLALSFLGEVKVRNEPRRWARTLEGKPTLPMAQMILSRLGSCFTSVKSSAMSAALLGVNAIFGISLSVLACPSIAEIISADVGSK